MKTETSTLPKPMFTAKKQITIFLVEDDKLYLHALGYSLHRLTNCKVYCYDSGEECLKNIHIQPDIIILDYYLNERNPEDMDGLEVLEKVKKIKNNTIVIMLSGQRNLSVAIKSLEAGAYTYLIKNKQTLSQLHEIIDQVILNFTQE